MRSGNPVLKHKNFSIGHAGTEVMTQNGAYVKTAILLALCIASASFTWDQAGMSFVMPGFIGGLILALVTIFKKQWSGITAPLYAICEGLALGGISYMYNAQSNGIVINAIMLTFGVMAIMLFLYSNE